MQHHTDITFRAVKLNAEQARFALKPDRGLCAAAFSPNGHFGYHGPAIIHLAMPDREAFSDYLTATALDMLRIDPDRGVLYIQADSKTAISAFYMPDATLDYIGPLASAQN